MKKAILIFVLINFILLIGAPVYGEEGYEEFNIKYGMHEKKVIEKYGEPLYVKNIKVNPIPVKKALYEKGEMSYMVLHFFSGRIYKITLLEEMNLDEAQAIFEHD